MLLIFFIHAYVKICGLLIEYSKDGEDYQMHKQYGNSRIKSQFKVRERETFKNKREYYNENSKSVITCSNFIQEHE